MSADGVDERPTLVLGLGNPVLADDSVGLQVARQLRERLGDNDRVEIDEDYWGGLRLMERLVGYDRAIVVDAVCTGAAPGTVLETGADAMQTQHCSSVHDVNLQTALALGRQVGARLPEGDSLIVVGIEAQDTTSFQEVCTPDVAAAIPQAVEVILRRLQTWSQQSWSR